MEKNTKLIFNSNIASQLVKLGCRIIDIVKNRDNGVELIHVFDNTEQFKIIFTALTEQNNSKKINSNRRNNSDGNTSYSITREPVSV